MIIRSKYHESKKDEFAMEVISEGINSSGEEIYYVRLLPEYQSKFQEGNKITELRKSLIGELYEIEESYFEQLRLL